MAVISAPVGSVIPVQINVSGLSNDKHVFDSRTSGNKKLTSFKVLVYLSGKKSSPNIPSFELDRDASEQVLFPIYEDDSTNPGTPLQYADSFMFMLDTKKFESIDPATNLGTGKYNTGDVMVQLYEEWTDVLSGKTVIERPFGSLNVSIVEPK